MAVRISGTGRDDGHPGVHRVEERLGRGRLRAVVRDLQEVDRRQAAPEQFGVDALLDIPGQEESL
jgi:hypothetical protein